MRIWQSFPRSFRLGFLACNNLSAGNILLNGTGQISFLFQMAQLIDPDMPGSAAARSGFDGLPYELVFSDDFNTANRTFWPGDDPFWEAANIKYGSTGDQERYGPAQITTRLFAPMSTYIAAWSLSGNDTWSTDELADTHAKLAKQHALCEKLEMDLLALNINSGSGPREEGTYLPMEGLLLNVPSPSLSVM
ncbi:beta-glucan synthesis-associated protein-domain-containing protein [Suillus fuscotomentosus]|uniref:Beta-glucan synthesis-associated protein-domain-containing protein n=1 Tax=Suillus fuscotomentosus TaxID=1912939 RepID=A0AAD4DSX6_9AGAM|nr:beta-glucan synthesis-associated protein-domain-containing protein [Suillus fuscotomentosus]KAG1891679.1 beta-glucan synthesis-associated protein-domain-containing protein [Suillus fuscotomentosus]